MNFKIDWAQLVAPISSQTGQRLPLQAGGQLALVERAVDDHGDAALKPPMATGAVGFAVDDVVGELHEVEAALCAGSFRQDSWRLPSEVVTPR